MTSLAAYLTRGDLMKENKVTPEDLKEFGARFTKDEWEYLCQDELFKEMMFVTIRGAELLANKLLSDQ